MVAHRWAILIQFEGKEEPIWEELKKRNGAMTNYSEQKHKV